MPYKCEVFKITIFWILLVRKFEGVISHQCNNGEKYMIFCPEDSSFCSAFPFLKWDAKLYVFFCMIVRAYGTDRTGSPLLKLLMLCSVLFQTDKR